MRGNVSNAMEKLMIKLLYLLLFAAYAGVPIPAQGAGQQKGHKVALVLSGGGARGASQIGVLRVFERESIPIDCIVGTSFGALVGGLYAIGYSPDEIEHILSGQDWNNILSNAPDRRLMPLTERRNSRYQAEIQFRGWFPELPTGLRGGQRLTEELDILTTSQILRAEYDFDKLAIQFRAVSTNLVDGSVYVFRQGPLTEALRASMSIPLLFTPLEKDGMLLADGGLADNLPTDVARDLGADIIIAVDVTSPLLKKNEIRNFIDVVDQSISLQMEKNVRENRKLANIVLQPGLEKFANDDYDKIPEIVKRGEEEAVRSMDQLNALLADVPRRPRPVQTPAAGSARIVESVSIRGLRQISHAQLATNVHVRPGEAVDPSRIGADVGRLYATRLFESVGYALEPYAENRYHLVYLVRESALNSLGVGLRYDNDYNFVALAEFTARQLFNSFSTATISTQFGGLENHFAVLRMAPSQAPFIFMEPRGEVLRLERLDIRDKKIVDKFTDKREGGRLMIGGSVLKQLEISGGYWAERVRIEGGSEPNRLAGSKTLAGLSFRLTRDSLDSRDFPGSGMALRVRVDKQIPSLGADTNYSKWEVDHQHYFSLSGKSTFRVNISLGYSHGPVPFYDLFFVGGHSFSQVASRQFLGLERDELAVRQMAVVGASYRRLLFAHSFGFIRRGYVTGIYNGVFSSSQQASPYNFDLLHGAGIGMALDTIFGPVRATAGWSEGGRLNAYFSVGPSF
jgi:NTE family protein